MKTCPNCGESVNKKAKTCPHCKRKFGMAGGINRAGTSMFMAGFYIICLCIPVIGWAVGAVVYALRSR